jgi:hypothetical protein
MLAVIALMLRDLQQMLAIGYHIVHMTRDSNLSSFVVVGIFWRYYEFIGPGQNAF